MKGISSLLGIRSIFLSWTPFSYLFQYLCWALDCALYISCSHRFWMTSLVAVRDYSYILYVIVSLFSDSEGHGSRNNEERTGSSLSKSTQGLWGWSSCRCNRKSQRCVFIFQKMRSYVILLWNSCFGNFIGTYLVPVYVPDSFCCHTWWH